MGDKKNAREYTHFSRQVYEKEKNRQKQTVKQQHTTKAKMFDGNRIISVEHSA